MKTKRLKITDLHGSEIKIENLQLAIMQADDNRHYRHLASYFQATDELWQTYWDDVYQKLINIQSEY